MTTVVGNGFRNAKKLAVESWGYAQRGFQITGYGVWIVATAAVVMYLPLERAFEVMTFLQVL